MRNVDFVYNGQRGGGLSMKIEMSLLELIAIQMGCDYLSDLSGLSNTQRTILAEKLERLPARESDLRDWNDALRYLTGDSIPKATAEDARAALISGLTAT